MTSTKLLIEISDMQRRLLFLETHVKTLEDNSQKVRELQRDLDRLCRQLQAPRRAWHRRQQAENPDDT